MSSGKLEKKNILFLGFLIFAILLCVSPNDIGRTKENSVLLSSKQSTASKAPYAEDNVALYPYPAKYMNTHKIHLDDVANMPRKEMNISTTAAYDQIDFEGLAGLRLKVNKNNLIITYFDHATVNDTMIVTAGTNKYTLKWNESVTMPLTGDVKVYGVLSREAKHNISATIKKANGEYFIYGTDSGYKNIPATVIDPKSEEVNSNKELTYPTSGKYGRCVHVSEWEDHIL